jgi:hypothetical protein
MPHLGAMLLKSASSKENATLTKIWRKCIHSSSLTHDIWIIEWASVNSLISSCFVCLSLTSIGSDKQWTDPWWLWIGGLQTSNGICRTHTVMSSLSRQGKKQKHTQTCCTNSFPQSGKLQPSRQFTPCPWLNKIMVFCMWFNILILDCPSAFDKMTWISVQYGVSWI